MVRTRYTQEEHGLSIAIPCVFTDRSRSSDTISHHLGCSEKIKNMSEKNTIGDILRSEISQIDDNIYQYIEGDYKCVDCGAIIILHELSLWLCVYVIGYFEPGRNPRVVVMINCWQLTCKTFFCCYRCS